MSNLDIPELKQEITKALKQKELAKILDLLKSLDTITATTTILQSTKIGVFITDLRKHAHSNEEIKVKCRELVTKWKSTVKSESKNTENSGSTVSGTIPTDDSTKELKIERSASKDNVKLPSLGNKVRNKCVEMIYNALAINTEAKSLNIVKISSQIEKCVYDQFGVDDQYKSKIKMLVSNLKSKDNQELSHRVLNGDLSPRDFATATAQELMSSHRKQVVLETTKQIMMDVITPTQQHAETDMFRCGKCGQRRTTYYQLQTRSADEPMTTFVTCVACNNRWKFC